MPIRLRTADPHVQASTRGLLARTVRYLLMDRLTDTQYRRVALLFGFDGPEMTQRDVAEIEDISHISVYEAKELAFDKLKNDMYLWFLWLVGKVFIPNDSAISADRGRVAALHASETRRRPGQGVEEERDELLAQGSVGHEPRPGGAEWDSDRFTPRSFYDRQVDTLMERFEGGGLSRVEYETEMVLALADQQNPNGPEVQRDELQQTVEWAVGAREIGDITREECDRRISRNLRAYVS